MAAFLYITLCRPFRALQRRARGAAFGPVAAIDRALPAFPSVSVYIKAGAIRLPKRGIELSYRETAWSASTLNLSCIHNIPEGPPKMKNEKIRLQKFLAQCAVSSRRGAEEMIAAGKVKVNGRPAKLGDKVDPFHDKVTVAGKRLVNAEKKMYIMLHKPRGFVTTMSDEQNRRCVADLVADAGVRLFPVGRLDRNSEGLLFMTNDGEFANILTHPSRHVAKVYRVTVREAVGEDKLDKMRDGMMIEGKKTLPCDADVIQREESRTVLRIVLYEGRNREIRKMCEQLGLTVIRLKRVEVAGVKLGMLPQGRWRELNEKEIHRLMSISTSKKGDAEND